MLLLCYTCYGATGNAGADTTTNLTTGHTIGATNGTTGATVHTHTANTIISIDVQNISLHELIKLLADFSPKNIIISEQISGKASLKLRNVPWQEALDIALKMHGLSKQEENSIIFIAPSQDIERYVKQQMSGTERITTPTFLNLKNASAEEVATILTKQNHLTNNSNISIDKQNNGLVVNATTAQLNAIQKLTNTLDLPTKQVLIEGQIVVADDKVINELGLKFNTIRGGSGGSGGGGFRVSEMTMDFPAAITAPGHLGIAIAKLGHSTILNMELAALEQAGRVKIISSPKLIAANNQPAYIESGQEIPYQEKTQSGATNTVFKKAVLSLKATPSVLSANKLTLNLHLNQDKVSDISVNGVPAIQTQQMQTQVTLNSGETVVLGGIYEYSTIENNTSIPGLSAIPLLGNLFRSKHTEVARKELIILVTPRII
jgi:type IV pilus assembly protein PilQ